MPAPRLRLSCKTSLSLGELATAPLEVAQQLQRAAERPLLHLDDPEAVSEEEDDDLEAARS